ncbi:hypothetical protein HDU96_006385 [Phlyctochytrium bullatum]|nr:hypothetical protein HDU96_006385 [Phlyctochytrium bullatum]
MALGKCMVEKYDIADSAAEITVGGRELGKAVGVEINDVMGRISMGKTGRPNEATDSYGGGGGGGSGGGSGDVISTNLSYIGPPSMPITGQQARLDSRVTLS